MMYTCTVYYIYYIGIICTRRRRRRQTLINWPPFCRAHLQYYITRGTHTVRITIIIIIIIIMYSTIHMYTRRFRRILHAGRFDSARGGGHVYKQQQPLQHIVYNKRIIINRHRRV